MIICEWCKKEENKDTGRFCTALCRNRYISSKNNYKLIGEKVSKTALEKITKVLLKLVCLNCSNEFNSTNKQRKFCTQKCAVVYLNNNKTEEDYNKQSEKIKKKIASGEFIPHKKTYTYITKECLKCKSYMTVVPSSNKKYCRKECSPIFLRPPPDKNSLAYYRISCKFTFNLSLYPEEFDFELLKKHGYYSPTNKNNNINGVSRDHMFSIRDGFDKKISPEIMKHPANCKLLLHKENISKHKNSSISYEELLEKIKSWDEKYNPT